MKTTFNRAKRDWTLAHRGLDFVVDAEKVTMIDDRFDYGEVRQISAGFLDRRMVVIVWTQRGTSRHVHFNEVLPWQRRTALAQNTSANR
jgi:uncharacterized DUF497 family protein